MTPQENLLKSLGYKDITKDNPIHFAECLGEFFENVYPYNKRFYKRVRDTSIMLKVGNIYNTIFISGICYYPKGWQKFELIAHSKDIEKRFKEIINAVLHKIEVMSLEEKFHKLKQLADAMYYSMQNLTTDTTKIREAMNNYRRFVIYELKEDKL